MSSNPLDHRQDPESFRAALRQWLPSAIPHDWKQRIKADGEEGYLAVQTEWYKTLTGVGLATAHWPESWGGAGLSIPEMTVYYEELALADAPGLDLYVISLYHLPATLMAYGTQDQRDRFLEGARTGGDIWCQGFSEPGSGSDLASLRTRAELRGDRYVVNGQKIWSSFGRYADYCLLLARTDPNAPRKQQGISYFILDMKSPGLDIRPIEQITGEAEFNEVFFDDVEIPVENLIGGENKGWQIAQSTLTAERGLLVFEQIARLGVAYRRNYARYQDRWRADPALAREYAAFLPRIRAMQSLTRQLLDELQADPHGGLETSTFVKLYSGVLIQEFNRLVARLDGLAGQIFSEPLRCSGHHSEDHMYDYLHSFAWSIAGGSNEIMRNIISERFLKLPR